MTSTFPSVSYKHLFFHLFGTNTSFSYTTPYNHIIVDTDQTNRAENTLPQLSHWNSHSYFFISRFFHTLACCGATDINELKIRFQYNNTWIFCISLRILFSSTLMVLGHASSSVLLAASHPYASDNTPLSHEAAPLTYKALPWNHHIKNFFTRMTYLLIR